MSFQHLDLEVLRTFVAAQDLGSFQAAARYVGRTPAAVSLQMQRLASLLGVALFRNPRRTELSPAGDAFSTYARRLLALNDESITAIHGNRLSGSVRVGLLQDFAETILPSTLALFKRACPEVTIEITVGRTVEMVKSWRRRELDLVVTFGEKTPDAIARLPMVWVTRAEDQVESPVALLSLPAPCIFREAAVDALAGRLRWRQVLTSPSLSGIWAAVEAGLGLTVRTPLGVPDFLRTVPKIGHHPALPFVGIVLLQRAEASAAVQQLGKLMREQIQLLAESAKIFGWAGNRNTGKRLTAKSAIKQPAHDARQRKRGR